MKQTKGAIIGIMLVGECFWFNPECNEHQSNDWITGPFIAKVIDIVQLKKPLSCRGGRDHWPISNRMHKKIINRKQISETLIMWQHKYKQRY